MKRQLLQIVDFFALAIVALVVAGMAIVSLAGIVSLAFHSPSALLPIVGVLLFVAALFWLGERNHE